MHKPIVVQLPARPKTGSVNVKLPNQGWVKDSRPTARKASLSIPSVENIWRQITAITTEVKICGRKITDLKNPENLICVLEISAADKRPRAIGNIE